MRRRMIKKCRYLIMRYCVKAEVVGRGGEVERWRGGGGWVQVMDLAKSTCCPLNKTLLTLLTKSLLTFSYLITKFT
jgi:transcriptional regulator CtsR